MSSIAKALIVINAVLGLAFLGFASALVYRSGDYKAKYDDEVRNHNLTRDQRQKEYSNLNAEYKRLQKENDAALSQGNQWKIDAEQMKNAYEQERTANAELRGKVEDIRAKIDNYGSLNQDLHKQLEELQKEKDRIRDAKEAAVTAQEKADAERNEAVGSMTKLKEDLANLQEAYEKVRKERDSLDAKLKVLTQRTGVGLDVLQAQPQIEASVVEVDNGIGFVALNVGRTQGVQQGFTFDIYQGRAYKGKVVVDKVEETFCSAKITLRAAGQTIEKGDQATTRL